MPEKIRDARLLEIALQGATEVVASAIAGEDRGLPEGESRQKYGEHLGNYIDRVTDGLRAQLRATKPTVLLFMDSLPAAAVNEMTQILADEGVAVTLICRVYYSPNGMGSPASITAYIGDITRRLTDLLTYPLVEQANREGRLWLKLYNETNIGIEGFPQGRAGFAPALAAWQQTIRAIRAAFPHVKIGSLANTPGNDDAYFYGDALNTPYWYHGAEAALPSPSNTNIAQAIASCPMRPMFEEADGIFTHMYAPETRMNSGELQTWYSRRFEQYLKFLPPNKPMFVCECDAGYDDGPQARAQAVVWWLRNVIDPNPRVAGICLWWNAAPGEGDPTWTKHYTRDAQGNVAPLVTAIAAYRRGTPDPTPEPPVTTPPRVVELAGLPLRIETPTLQTGQKYWFARRIVVQTPERSGGSRSIFLRTFRDNQRTTGVLVRVAWQGGSSLGITAGKPLTERGDWSYAMTGTWDPTTGAGPYSATVAQGITETVRGMGVPNGRNYALIVEFEEITHMPTDPALITKLHTTSESRKVLSLNPQAALQKEIFRRGYVPTSPEFTIEHGGKRYIGQRAEKLSDGKVAVAWVESGKWDAVQWTERK